MAKHQKNFDAGVGALVIKEGSVLLGERKNISHEGYFGIPGGRIDIGENIIAAGERELYEETGLEAQNSELSSVTSTRHVNEESLFFGFCLLVTDYNGVVKNREPEKCEGWDFYALDDLPENIFAPHRYFIHNYLEKRNFSEHVNE